MTATPMHWIETPAPGRLAVSSRPRGHDWLVEEVENWRANGIAVVVSLLTDAEVEELGLHGEETAIRQAGMEFVQYSIEDRGLPESRASMVTMCRQLAERIRGGENVVIHCRAGVGRSAMVAAGILSVLGVDPDEALRRITRARRVPTPDTPEQTAWIMGLKTASSPQPA